VRAVLEERTVRAEDRGRYPLSALLSATAALRPLNEFQETTLVDEAQDRKSRKQSCLADPQIPSEPRRRAQWRDRATVQDRMPISLEEAKFSPLKG
jgi:hypothetical protein